MFSLKELLVVATVGVVYCISASAQGLPPDIPLPPNLQLTKPADELPPKLKAFAGKWVGSWDGIVGHVLVVEEISSPDRVVVIYAYGKAESRNIWKPAWFRVVGKFSGETLELRLGNGAFVTYSLSGDNQIRGTWELSPWINRISMTRVPE